MLTEQHIAIIPLCILTENSSITVQMVRIPGFHPSDLDSRPIYGMTCCEMCGISSAGAWWLLVVIIGVVFWFLASPGSLWAIARLWPDLIGGILISTCWDHSAQVGEQPRCSNFLFTIDSNYLHYWSPTSYLQCWGLVIKHSPSGSGNHPATSFIFFLTW
jgi:hypothetical protein